MPGTVETVGRSVATPPLDQVDYDPRQVSYGALLEKFWEGHEPTDQSWSRQYMAAVFYRDDGQRRAAEASKARLEAKLGRKISTAILPLGTFTLAEDYHQWATCIGS